MVWCRKIEAVTISRIVKSIDPEAFITQTNVNGVYGKGFDQLKVKMKKKTEPAPEESSEYKIEKMPEYDNVSQTS